MVSGEILVLGTSCPSSLERLIIPRAPPTINAIYLMFCLAHQTDGEGGPGGGQVGAAGQELLHPSGSNSFIKAFVTFTKTYQQVSLQMANPPMSGGSLRHQ